MTKICELTDDELEVIAAGASTEGEQIGGGSEPGGIWDWLWRRGGGEPSIAD